MPRRFGGLVMCVVTMPRRLSGGCVEASVARARWEMVAELERRGAVVTPAVRAAMLAVPRHVFLDTTMSSLRGEAPGSTSAYDPFVAVATRVHGDEVTSSLSSPELVASM